MLLTIATMVLLFSPASVSADVVWEDNFNDNNLDDWDFKIGMNLTLGIWRPMEAYVSASDGVMKFTAPNQPQETEGMPSTATGNYTYIVQVCRPSTATTGHWSFDVTTRTSQTWSAVLFISQGEDFTNKTPDEVNRNYRLKDYGFFFDYGGNENTISVWGNNKTLHESTHYFQPSKWHHVDITRTSSGDMKVYINGTLILSGSDASTTESKKFCIMGNQAHYDNVKLDSNSSYVPPVPATTSDEGDSGLQDIMFVSLSGLIMITIINRKSKFNDIKLL
jgi:hypothetical protein